MPAHATAPGKVFLWVLNFVAHDLKQVLARPDQNRSRQTAIQKQTADFLDILKSAQVTFVPKRDHTISTEDPSTARRR